jgi:hypothetical protein
MCYHSLFLKTRMLLELTQFLMLFCKKLMGSLFIMTNSLDVPHKMAIIWPDTFGELAFSLYSHRVFCEVRKELFKYYLDSDSSFHTVH